MVTPFIPYFFSIHLTAFLKGALLSVTILIRLPYLHTMSSNSHCPIDLVFSSLNALDSIHNDNLHWPCTMYLHLFDGEFMCTVSACNTWNIDGIYVTMGGIFRARFCLIWYKWHVLTYQMMSSSIPSHQNLCCSGFSVAYAPLCPMSLWHDLSKRILSSLTTTSWRPLFLAFLL